MNMSQSVPSQPVLTIFVASTWCPLFLDTKLARCRACRPRWISSVASCGCPWKHEVLKSGRGGGLTTVENNEAKGRKYRLLRSMTYGLQNSVSPIINGDDHSLRWTILNPVSRLILAGASLHNTLIPHVRRRLHGSNCSFPHRQSSSLSEPRPESRVVSTRFS